MNDVRYELIIYWSDLRQRNPNSLLGQIVSVALCRLRNMRSGFADSLSQSGIEFLQGAIVVVEDGRQRIRKVPIGGYGTALPR